MPRWNAAFRQYTALFLMLPERKVRCSKAFLSFHFMSEKKKSVPFSFLGRGRVVLVVP